jgi:hypothetical protein
MENEKNDGDPLDQLAEILFQVIKPKIDQYLLAEKFVKKISDYIEEKEKLS